LNAETPMQSETRQSETRQSDTPTQPGHAVPPDTPIQPIVLGSSEAALNAQQSLLRAGFRVVAIRSPTVPRGSERLRITLSAAHTEEQVDGLVEALSQILARQPAIG
jgi:7-keto-8-aminopelargonate synthetase-like enzyme